MAAASDGHSGTAAVHAIPPGLTPISVAAPALFVPNARAAEHPLFRTTRRTTGEQHRMTQPDAYRMIQRRTLSADIITKIGNHSLRATWITDYLKRAGTLEHAQAMSNTIGLWAVVAM